jgi:predicted GH43/DUF377 family glycosyl hydrolase
MVYKKIIKNKETKKKVIKKTLKKEATLKKVSKNSKPIKKKKTIAKQKTQSKKIFRKKESKEEAVKLLRCENNPIISPVGENYWESNQTFNPTAALIDGKIYLLYRSIGDDGISRFGYATSYNGEEIDERSKEPVFSIVDNNNNAKPLLKIYLSGGSLFGVEDPRMTIIENSIYILFTILYRNSLPRIGFMSISKKDFCDKRWNWSQFKIISPPNETHKNWALFPEKINGKYAILNSISPKISIEYLDNLNFEENKYIKSFYGKTDIKDGWEKNIRGIGPSPIKTKYGWLVIYHASSEKYGYAIGAMILDYKNPEKIIARSKNPIIEPVEWYEVHGYNDNIIYSCGAVVLNDDLLIYYGAADRVSCVAKINLNDLLENIIKDKKVKTVKKKISK